MLAGSLRRAGSNDYYWSKSAYVSEVDAYNLYVYDDNVAPADQSVCWFGFTGWGIFRFLRFDFENLRFVFKNLHFAYDNLRLVVENLLLVRKNLRFGECEIHLCYFWKNRKFWKLVEDPE